MRWLSLLVAAGLMVVAAGCGDKKTTSNKEGDKKLTVTGPTTTDIHPGGTADVTVKVTRTGFDDDVTVAFADLPDGVTVTDSEKKIAKGTTEKKFTLKASDTAPEASTKAKVTASAKEVDKPATVEFTVNVKKKK